MQGTKFNNFIGLIGCLGFAILALSAGCGGSDSPSSNGGGAGTGGAACTPNQQIQCTCADNVTLGTETCGPTGVWGLCLNCPGGGASGTGAAGIGVAQAGISGGVAGTFGQAGVGAAGTFGQAGIGAAGIGAAGVGAAGTGTGMSCTAPETCQALGPLMFCGSSPIPSSCTMINMPCGASGGTCLDGAALGFAGSMFCIKMCTP